jgi:hypothetical protein
MAGTISSGGSKDTTSTPTKDTTTPSKDGSTSAPSKDTTTPPSKNGSTSPTKGGKEVQMNSAQMSKRVSQANSGSTPKGRTGTITSSSSAKPAKVVFALPKGMGTGVKFGKK